MYNWNKSFMKQYLPLLCDAHYYFLLSFAERKKSDVDHKATEMISLFTSGSQATLWETEPWRNSCTCRPRNRKSRWWIVCNNKKFGKNKRKRKQEKNQQPVRSIHRRIYQDICGICTQWNSENKWIRTTWISMYLKNNTEEKYKLRKDTCYRTPFIYTLETGKRILFVV